jgi:Ser/Thr protein kinase RdoA (MazF antagonist)
VNTPDTVAPDLLAALHLPPAASSVRMPGYEAEVWRTELADGRVVAVRLLRAGIPADGELAALRLAAAHRQPVPAIVAHGRWAGRHAIVTAWCRGRSMGELLEDGGDPGELGRLMGRAHAALHEPVADGQVLCHLDFQPYNILLDGGEISAVVDWGNAHLGDRRDDLAWTVVVLALAPDLLPALAGGIDPFRQGWRDGYAERRDLPGEDELRPFLAYAAARQLADWAPRRCRRVPGVGRPGCRSDRAALEQLTGSVRSRT